MLRVIRSMAVALGLSALAWASMIGIAAAQAADSVAVLTLDMVASGDADGAGVIDLELDPNTGEVCYRLAAVNIGLPTSGHIHVAPPGVAGPVAIDLDVGVNRYSGCVSASPADVLAVLADLGGHYVNMHTLEFPSGAIRADLAGTAGQVDVQLDFNPSRDADGSGGVILSLDAADRQVCFDIVVENIAEATASHIHVGESGIDGPVLIDLDVAANGLTGCAPASALDILTALADPSGHYINVHTVEYPAGAIRAQLDKTATGPLRTATPVPTATALPVATATAIPVATATAIPVATATPIPVATATAIPVATATAVPLPTAVIVSVVPATIQPTPVADKVELAFTGGSSEALAILALGLVVVGSGLCIVANSRRRRS